jgi:hypothetical protein
VLLIDDLIATGGTLLAGVELVKRQQVRAGFGFFYFYFYFWIFCWFSSRLVGWLVVCVCAPDLGAWGDGGNSKRLNRTHTQGVVVEAACMIELAFLGGGDKVSHSATQSGSHSVTQSLSHSVTRFSHSVTRSVRQIWVGLLLTV